MDITIRRAEKRDCVRLLELIQELAEYEKAPNEVTVTLSHFEDSGFGANPVLFDTLIKEAKEKKFSGMNWQVLEWNEPAINFYKKYNANLDPEWHNGSIVF